MSGAAGGQQGQGGTGGDSGQGGQQGQGGTGGDSGQGGQQGQGGTGGATPPWHGVADPEGAAYIQTKGWQNPGDVIKSYQNAEKLIGRDPNTLLSIPKADDTDGFRAVMSKLGLPDTPDKYEIHVPEGQQPNEAFVGWSKNTFHKLGLTAAQAKDLTKEYNAYADAQFAQERKDYDIRLGGEKAALLQEWGAGHERMMASAKNAAKALGFEAPVVDAIEKSIGYAKTMKLFAGLGQKMSEDGFVSADGGKRTSFDGMMTPAEAKAEWDAMRADPAQSKALFDGTHPGNAAAKAKQQRLFAIMYPEK